MTRVLTRTHFHTSDLIRTLVDLAVLQTTEPAAAVGEKMGSWIGFTDAIALTAVHNASVFEDTARTTPMDSPVALAEVFAKMRNQLENTVTRNQAPDTGRIRAELVLPKLDVPLDDVKVYTPFRRYHLAHQRNLETQVRNVRARLRESVGKAAPQLKQLVDLDATFDGILVEREARLLGTIPSLMEKRFNHLRKVHLQSLADTQQTDDNPDLWMQPGAWLARFCTELQAVLLAELDLRLQPAVGLLEAFLHKKTLEPV